jgi:hypothetical protein
MNEVRNSSTTWFDVCASGLAPNNGPTKQQQQNCLAGYNNSTAGKVVQFFSLYNLATNFKSAWPDWTVVPAVKLAAVKLINTASQAFGNTEFLSIAGAQSTTVLAPTAAGIEAAEAAGAAVAIPAIALATGIDATVHADCSGNPVLPIGPLIP